eukprot:8994590-Pyramimonas_sp.AAC.1
MGESFRSVDFNQNPLWAVSLRILLRRSSMGMPLRRVSVGILPWRVSLGILLVGASVAVLLRREPHSPAQCQRNAEAVPS